MKFYSAIGIDRFVWENFFRGHRQGTFVEVGAADGENFSNTLFFERSMAWTGLRTQAVNLQTRLEQLRLFDIDYCSYAVRSEGLGILSDLDLERFHTKVLSIESSLDDPLIVETMQIKGYQLFAKFERTYIFKRADVKPLPLTSVICAVWHHDPERHARLCGHVENLSRQSVPVAPIYVFDAGDPIPEWLTARAISVNEPLTIYQAWNVALSLVETPLVMNLNLDDRLAPDAVEFLQSRMLREGAIAAGADWKVCFTQEETDAVAPCFPAENLPLAPDWPPKPGTLRRLGNTDLENIHFGPATMWRVDAHARAAPRLPWRLQEGTLLQVCGDLAWWLVLANVPNAKVLRLPVIIGNYYSHPTEQAEFRVADERPLLFSIGISIL